MATMVSERSVAQRAVALAKANEVRCARAALKRDLAEGRVRVVDVLSDPPAWVGTMKVLDVLMSAPRVGRVKALKVLGRVNVSPVKLVGGLTVRQRALLVWAVGGWR